MLAAWAATAAAAPAPEAKEPRATPYIPGGVADADGSKGFVVNANGVVTALDLETGKPLWESKTAGRPLVVAGGRAWVQARDKDKGNVLRVVGLAVDDGKPAVESDPITLPEWVSAVEGHGAGRSFTSSACRDGGDILIRWQANAWYWGGAAPPPQVEKAARKQADGVARVNLGSGKVEMLDSDKAPPPAPADKGAAAVDVEVRADGKQKVLLKRRDPATDKPLDPLVLAEGLQYQVVTTPSAGVALLRDATPGTGAAPGDTIWTVYSVATGKETAHFTAEANAGEFTAVGPRAYYVLKGTHKGPPFGGVLPRTLKAVDLKTSKHLWEFALEGERLPPPPPP